jgi:hypothetical protein
LSIDSNGNAMCSQLEETTAECGRNKLRTKNDATAGAYLPAEKGVRLCAIALGDQNTAASKSACTFDGESQSGILLEIYLGVSFVSFVITI